MLIINVVTVRYKKREEEYLLTSMNTIENYWGCFDHEYFTESRKRTFRNLHKSTIQTQPSISQVIEREGYSNYVLFVAKSTDPHTALYAPVIPDDYPAPQFYPDP